MEEVIEAVREHQEDVEAAPVQEDKRLLKEMEKMEKFIQETPSRIDEIARIKRVHRLPWKERAQVAFSSFVSIWREQCRKQ